MRSLVLVPMTVLVMSLVGCTDEPTNELDLDGTLPTTSVPDEQGDPNAEARAQVEEFARQQCLDDPDLDVGVVVFADEATGEEVSRYELPCEQARDAVDSSEQ